MCLTVLATSSAAEALESASRRTSSATTAKPRPCSPARAASMAALRASRLVCDEICLIRSMNAVIGSDRRVSSWTCSVDARTTSRTSSRVCPAAATSERWRAASSWMRSPSSRDARGRLGVRLGDLAQASQQRVGLLHPAHLLLRARGDLDHGRRDLAAARGQLLAHRGEIARAVADLARFAHHRDAPPRADVRPCRPSRAPGARSRWACPRPDGWAGGRRRRTAPPRR